MIKVKVNRNSQSQEQTSTSNANYTPYEYTPVSTSKEPTFKVKVNRNKTQPQDTTPLNGAYSGVNAVNRGVFPKPLTSEALTYLKTSAPKVKPLADSDEAILNRTGFTDVTKSTNGMSQAEAQAVKKEWDNIHAKGLNATDLYEQEKTEQAKTSPIKAHYKKQYEDGTDALSRVKNFAGALKSPIEAIHKVDEYIGEQNAQKYINKRDKWEENETKLEEMNKLKQSNDPITKTKEWKKEYNKANAYKYTPTNDPYSQVNGEILNLLGPAGKLISTATAKIMGKDKVKAIKDEQSQEMFERGKTGVGAGLETKRAESYDNLTKDLSDSKKFMVDIGLGATQLGTDLMVSAGTGVPLPVMYGVTGGAEAGQNALKQGYTPEQSMALAIGSGIITGSVETLGGVGGNAVAKGFSKVINSPTGKAVVNKIPQKVIEYISKGANSKVGEIIGDALSEGTEEALEYGLQLGYKNLLLDENTPFDVKEAISNAVLGGAIGGLFGGGKVAVNSTINADNKAELPVIKVNENKATKPVNSDVLSVLNSTTNNTTNNTTINTENIIKPQVKADALNDTSFNQAEFDRLNGVTNKSRRIQNIKEKELVKAIAETYGITEKADIQMLKDQSTKLAREIKENGKLSDQTQNDILEMLYGGETQADANTLDYDEFKALKTQIKTPVKPINSSEKSDFAEGFNSFRKSNMGNLSIKKNAILQVDQLYNELSRDYPSLFPNDLSSQSEQLQRMSEVSKRIKKKVKTKGLSSTTAGARAEQLSALLDKFTSDINVVKTVESERSNRLEARKFKNVADDVTQSELTEAYKKVKELTKQKDKIVSNALLTQRENNVVNHLLDGTLTLDTMPAGIDTNKVLSVYGAKRSLYDQQKVIDQYDKERRERLREMSNSMIEESVDWKDKSMGFLYSRETPERNIVDIVKDKEKAEALNDYLFTPIHDSEANSTRFKNAYKEKVKELDLNQHESVYTQLLGEYQYAQSRKGKQYTDLKDELSVKIQDYNKKYGDKINKQKCADGVKEFRKIYDDLIQRANDVLLATGQKPIEYRKDYFPHFTEEKAQTVLGKALEKAGFKINRNQLPTEIAGRTHEFRPNKKWFGNAQQRQGEFTDYDALKGFERYINGISDVIHHTENVIRLRDFENAIRYKYSTDGAKAEIDEIEGANLTYDEKQRKLSEVYERGTGHLPNFVTYLRDYTDTLAGKKSLSDRTMEYEAGRVMYSAMSEIENRIAGNMVAINPASWLTNFIPITQGYSELSTKSLTKALNDARKNTFNDDGYADLSSFLTNRRGSEKLVQSKGEKISEAMTKPMFYIDDFTSNVLSRARTYDNMKKGMDKNSAIAESDKWTAGVMADRSKGALPTIFNHKNPIIKVATMFQVEVNNQLSYAFKDIPKATREKGAKELTKAFLKMFIGAFLYNELYEKLTGRRPALDPIGIVKDTIKDFTSEDVKNSQAIANTGKNIAQEMPFIGGLLGGGRLPINSAIPDFAQLTKVTDSEVNGKKKAEILTKELSKPLTYLALPFGGGQVKKVVEGADTLLKGGSYTHNNAGQKELQFPIHNVNPVNVMQALTFGKYSTKEGQEYIKNGFDKLNPKQTQAYDLLLKDGADSKTAYDTVIKVQQAKKTSEKRDVLMSVENLSVANKNIIDELMINSNAKVDYSNKDTYETSTLTDSDKNKYTLAKNTMGVSYEKFIDIKSQLKDVKAKKDVNGNTIKNSRKYECIRVLKGMGYNQSEAERLYNILY